MTYLIQKHLTNINKGKKGDNKPEWIIVHFVGAAGQALANANYFKDIYREASAQYFIDPKNILQVVEDDTPAWHVGDGSRTLKGKHNGYAVKGGATNTNTIGIELCQDITTGKDVWNWDFHPETIKRAEWLIRKLQVEYSIDDDHVIRHFDASGKVCPGNWQHNDWAKWWALKDRLEKDIIQPAPSATPKDEGKFPSEHMYLVQPGDTLYSIARGVNTSVDNLIKWNNLDNPNLIFPETKLFVLPPEVADIPASNHIEQLARDTIAGKYGNGAERKSKLGADYDAVQVMVNDILLGKVATKLAGANPATVPPVVSKPAPTAPKTAKTIEQLAAEVIRGAHGSGRERMISLGSNYAKVQAEVNRLMRK